MPKDRWTFGAWIATVLLLALCLTPKRLVPAGERLSPRVPHQDKAVHVALFLAFGLCWAKARAPGPLSGRRAAGVLAAAAVLAVGTELAQGLEVIDRDPDALDALADAVGAAVGVGLAAAWGRT
jgi:hypothetical protein